MLRNLKLNVFYPYSPEQVWQAITNRRTLAAWLMENDFEPRVGHKFRFIPNSQQEFNETIYCEVIELDAPKSLSYTWRGSLTSKPTLVTWILLPVEGGTQLQLEHKGFESEVTTLKQPMHLALDRHNHSTPKAFVDTQLFQPIERGTVFHRGYAKVNNVDTTTLSFYLSGGWHLTLNNLQNLLTNMTQEVTSHL